MNPDDTRRTHPRLVLAICCASMFVVALDSSIVNVALPSIGRDLDVSGAVMSWVVDGYTLTLAALLISSGVLADRHGRRRMFRYGLVLFGAGSLLCSVAPNLPLLVGARVVQGVGGSMLNPVALAIIGSVFNAPAGRARAMGTWGAVLGAAMALGPLAGGLLTDAFGWRAIFLVNLPVCAVAVWAATRWVPESFGERRHRLDVPGQVCTVGAMFLVVLAIIELPRLGVGAVAWQAIAAGFVVFAAAAMVRTARARHPFIDPAHFRRAPFAVANGCALAASGAQGVLVFTLSVLLQSGLGHSPVDTGLRLLPIALGTVVFSTFSGAALARFGPVPPLAAGGIVIGLPGAVLLGFGAAGPVPVLFAVFCFGAGFGLANAPITSTAVTGMGAAAGAAGGVVSTGRQLGMSIGVAFAGAVSAPARQFVAPSWIAVLGCGLLILTGAAVLSGYRTRAAASGT